MFRIVKVCAALLLPIFVVGSVTLETPSVSTVLVGYSTLISGPLAVPVRAMSKGFSSASLLAMWMAAVRVPLNIGLNVTVKVVLLPGAHHFH